MKIAPIDEFNNNEDTSFKSVIAKKQSSRHIDKNKNNIYSSNIGTYRKTMI